MPTLVLSDQGVITAVKLEEVDAFFASSMQQYENVTSAHPSIKFIIPLSEDVAGCQIVWEHHDNAGKLVGGEVTYYMLKCDDQALHIHVYTPMIID